MKMLLAKIRYYGLPYIVISVLVRLKILEKEDLWLHATKRFGKRPESRLKADLTQWYYCRTGKHLDIDHPVTYNEKVQWLKLYDTTPLKTELSDKYRCREWIGKKIGKEYLVTLLGAWDSFDEIDFDRLPNRFVIKCNHGSGMNIIVNDKKTLDLKMARKKIEKWMKIDFSCVFGYELQYRGIQKKIIIEEYLENDGGDLYDYKFWFNNGKLEFIMFLEDRKSGLTMTNFDSNWQRLDFTYGHPQSKREIPKPDNLDEMVRLATELAQGFYHVRVDFYRLNDGTVKFGEMTFTSAAGTQKWYPEAANVRLGNRMVLPVDG